MTNKLYYTVTFETTLIDDFSEQNGLKTIYVYDIRDNIPVLLTSLEADNTDKSDDIIQDYLEDNGYGDNLYEFIEL